MESGLFESLGEAIVIQEGLAPNESAILESMDIEVLENKHYLSEVDEVRINETAEIMADVFSEEVLANWVDMSLDEKAEKLNEYYIKAGDNLGIQTKGVVVEPMDCDTPGMTAFGYNSGDGYIHLNEAVVDDPSQLGQVLDTATHEMRHQFQSDVLASPEKFPDIPQDVLDTWRYEMDPWNYINPDYDFEGYYNQFIESDARGFSDDVLQAYTGKMNLN